MMKRGFSLLELLIVIGVIAILITLESFVFANSQKSARDGRRKADLENIRAALEQYRSNNSTYPPASAMSISTNGNCTNANLIDSSGNTYIAPLPLDPRCSQYFYDYITDPPTCDGTATVCTDYVISSKLETNSSADCPNVAGDDCTVDTPTDNACEYCLGPYGQK